VAKAAGHLANATLKLLTASLMLSREPKAEDLTSGVLAIDPSVAKTAGHLANATLKRLTASLMLSREPKAEARTKPSPPGPKPEPGVVTMSHLSKMSVKTSLHGGRGVAHFATSLAV